MKSRAKSPGVMWLWTGLVDGVKSLGCVFSGDRIRSRVSRRNSSVGSLSSYDAHAGAPVFVNVKAVNLENRRNLSVAELWAGIALRHLRRFDEGRNHLQKALELQQELYEIDRSNVGEVNSLADCNLELGWTISESGNPKEALKYFEKAISLYENVAKTDTNNLSALRQISFTRRHLADAVAKAGNISVATQIYETALRETETIIQRDEKNSEFRHDKAICLLRLAGQRSNALTNLNQAIQILEKLVAESPEHMRRSTDLENARDLLAKLT